MTSQAEKAERFRALHHREAPFVVPNPWDAGSARILEALGFEALATTSAGFAFTLGRRDGPHAVTLDETLANARAIAEAVDVPVTADLQNGFSDEPEGVAETIRRAAEAGLAGASIEDATGIGSSPIYAREVAVRRIRVAAAAARALPFPFVLTARAENFLYDVDDLDDTIARVRAYAAAGAHVVYAPALPDLEALATLCRAVDVPVNALASGSPPPSVADYARAGARRISVGGTLARVALGALQRAGAELREAGTFGFAASAPSFGSLASIMRAT